MYVHKIGVNGTMCAFSQSVVKPILIYYYSLDSVEYHNIGMIYINAIISAYEKIYPAKAIFTRFGKRKGTPPG